MQGSLKQNTIKGMIWNSIEKFGTLIISFVVNIILARKLMPEDFGCISMLLVFISISEAFIEGGFGTALIQKKVPTDDDYSTAFYWNIVLSVVFYVTLFVCAPVISRFYHIALLSKVLRIEGVILISNSLSIIQRTILQKKMNFKQLAKINLFSVSLGSVVGVILAYLGWGVWSLVVKMLISSICTTSLLWTLSKWHFSGNFNKDSFKGLFSFGGLMLLSNLVDRIYSNAQALLIGRCLSAKDLGYYEQARKLEEIPVSAITSVVPNVSMPVFSELQDDKLKLRDVLRKNIKMISFVTIPLMILMIVIAEPLFTLLYTSKWSSSIPYFRIICLSGLLMPSISINQNICRALGKGPLFFNTQLFKRVIGICVLIIGVRFGGMYGLLWSFVAVTFFDFVVSSFVSHRLIDYGFIKQICDLVIFFAISTVSALIIYFSLSFLKINYMILLVLQVVLYCLVYLLICKLLRLKELQEYCDIFAHYFHNKEMSLLSR